MRIATVVCNVAVFAITCMIVVTEGIPRQTVYVVLTLLPLFVPILTLATLLGGRKTRRQQTMRDVPSRANAVITHAAILGNVVLVGFSCWAAIAQYPYAEGSSVIPFALLMVGTPIVSSLVLLRASGRKTQGRRPVEAA